MLQRLAIGCFELPNALTSIKTGFQGQGVGDVANYPALVGAKEGTADTLLASRLKKSSFLTLLKRAIVILRIPIKVQVQGNLKNHDSYDKYTKR